MTQNQPYQAPNYAAAQVQPPMNVMSIVSFVLSLLGFNIVAVILGHIGLNQTKRTGERGGGFAIAGLIIGYLSLAAIVLVIIIMLMFLPAAMSTAS